MRLAEAPIERTTTCEHPDEDHGKYGAGICLVKGGVAEHFKQVFNIMFVRGFRQPSALIETRSHFDPHAFLPLHGVHCA
eukprot:1548280-Amphidinium_carterae.1